MMIDTLTSSDFIPFDKFNLKWRFTEAKYHVLPEHDLSLISPLSKSKATEFNNASLKYLGNACLLRTKVEHIESIKTNQDANAVTSWLTNKEINNDSKIIVSWDRTDCVLTYWKIFTKYWDAFCYTNSDDILVWSPSSDWRLYYCHKELFEYGKLKRT